MGMATMTAITEPEILATTGRSWDDARDDVRALLQLAPDWDGEGADPVRRELIAPALAFLQQMKARGFQPAEFVYATAGGTIMLEFHEPSGVVLVANIRTEREAEVITRTPGEKPAFRVVPISPPSGRQDPAFCLTGGLKTSHEFGPRPDPHSPRWGGEAVDQFAERVYRLAP